MGIFNRKWIVIMHRIDSKTIKTHTLDLQRFLNLYKQINGSIFPQLVEDGKWGAKTEQALEDYLEDFDSVTFGIWKSERGTTTPYYVETARHLRMIYETAAVHIGEKELPRNMGFVKKAFANLMDAVGFQKGHAWCAYFAEACYMQVLGNSAARKAAYTKLFSASTQTTLRNFAKHPNFILVPDSISYNDMEFVAPAGCMAFWQSRSKPAQGHVGIKTLDQDLVHHSKLKTIDGNTNDGGSREGNQVAAKTRDITSTTSSLRFQGLIFGDFLDIS